jgi:ferredoxin-type protein NapF
MTRRLFFGRVKNSPFISFVHPPYFGKKEDFIKCGECENKDCLTACKENIIEIKNGFPVLNFKISGCTFCDECAKACKYEVLSLKNKKDKINAEMIINPKKCIAWNQTICFACQDTCEECAIIYKGLLNPVIDLDKCTGCGFCINVCPTDAIEIKVV